MSKAIILRTLGSELELKVAFMSAKSNFYEFPWYIEINNFWKSYSWLRFRCFSKQLKHVSFKKISSFLPYRSVDIIDIFQSADIDAT